MAVAIAACAAVGADCMAVRVAIIIAIRTNRP